MAPLLYRPTTFVAITAITATSILSNGNGNTVAAITQRTSCTTTTPRRLNNYSNGLDVVKSTHAEEEEYVTSFYRRVREKRRATLFGEQQQFENDQSGQQKVGGNYNDRLDHSLDHYFDHQLSSSYHCDGNKKKKVAAAEVVKEESKAKDCREPVQPSPSSFCAARRVRGGEAAPRLLTVQRPSSHDDNNHVSAPRGNNLFGRKNHSRHSNHRHGHGHHGSHNVGGHHSRPPQKNQHYPRPSLQDPISSTRPPSSSSSSSSSAHHKSYYDSRTTRSEPYQEPEEEDDFPDHHLGLLRVPCSIAINAGEAVHHDHAQHHSHHHHPSHHHSSSHHGMHEGHYNDGLSSSQAKTPMAAYVDTGAQVTIISASAAKRAGIYHLMDRRYAGRATGVGHCKVLGRIPARHVYFLLGECNDDRQDAYPDEDYEDEPYHDEDSSSNMVQMDGPALTVLEGTVTRNVDILLGLDVLQDWEAEIRMSPEGKSITVKKRRRGRSLGGEEKRKVVIPFASSGHESDVRRRIGPQGHHHRQQQQHSSSRRHHHASQLSSMTHHDRRRHESNYVNDNIMDNEEEDNDDSFSPTASDIESDLDLLDQSGREFPQESYIDKNHFFQDDDGDLEEEEEDYLQDVEEEEDILMDGEGGEIDMSGL